MGQREIIRVAEMLHDTELGTWLESQIDLVSINRPPAKPSIVVIGGSDRDSLRAFPERLLLEPGWIEIDRGMPKTGMVELVEKSDLVIWIMPALRMFPADYVSVLETARKCNIPIWAIVVGLEGLGNPEAFTREQLPRQKVGLPRQSEVIPRDGRKPDIPETIQALLVRRGADLATAGWKRRIGDLNDIMRARLEDELRKQEKSLKDESDQLHQAELSAKSAIVIANATSTKILLPYQSLSSCIEDCKTDLLKVLMRYQKNRVNGALQDALTARIVEWQSTELVNQLNLLSLQVHQEWQKFQKELDRQFSIYGELQASNSPDSNLSKQLSLLLDQLNNDIRKLASEVQIDIDEDMALHIIHTLNKWEMGKNIAKVTEEVATELPTEETIIASLVTKAADKLAELLQVDRAVRKVEGDRSQKFIFDELQSLQESITNKVASRQSQVGELLKELVEASSQEPVKRLRGEVTKHKAEVNTSLRALSIFRGGE